MLSKRAKYNGPFTAEDAEKPQNKALSDTVPIFGYLSKIRKMSVARKKAPPVF